MQLFWVFFKIGPITFGGGYAMLPLIEREIVDKKKWIKTEDISEILALAGTVPGAIAVNCATCIGFRLAGIKGALVSMMGVLFPTFAIVCTCSIVFSSFDGNPHVEAAFIGIRASVVAMIVFAAVKVSRTAIFDKATFILMIVMVILMLVFHLPPISVIFLGAFFGILINTVKKKRGMFIKLDKITSKDQNVSVKKQKDVI